MRYRSLSGARWCLALVAAVLVSGSVQVPAVARESPPVLTATGAAPLGPAPQALTVGRLTAPVDIDSPVNQVFGWQVGAGMQTAYQIRVATTESLLADTPDIWDSGTVMSTSSSGVPYAGPVLGGNNGFYWQVRTWDASDEPSEWSTAAHFGTGPRAEWGHAVPIWLGGTADWRDYTFRGSFVVASAYAGVTFRVSDVDNYYLAQFRTGSNALVLQKNVRGVHAVLRTVPLPAALRVGERHTFAITAVGSSLTIEFDGLPVVTVTDAGHPSGGVGFRHGSVERADYDELDVVGTDGRVLYRNAFDSGVSDFSCATVTSGALSVPSGANCFTGVSWSDYTLRTTVVIKDRTAGVAFRVRDSANYYLWQLKAGNPGTLVLNKKVNGVFTALRTVSLGRPIVAGTAYRWEIEAFGSRIRTLIDGRLIDTRIDTTFTRGTIGWRTGGTEEFSARAVTVTLPGGTVAYRTTFPTGTRDFTCGTASGTELVLGRFLDCQLQLRSNWTFLRGEVDLDPSRTISWAHLYATGSSTEPARQYVYKLWLNGQFVGAGPTRPVTTETRYDGYDVTDLLLPGANALGTLAYTTQDQRFLARLVVRYTDGTSQEFGTGPGWRSLSGAGALPTSGSIGTGYFAAPKEDFGAESYPFGFDAPGFDDFAWGPVTVKAPFTSLVAAPTGKIVQQFHSPVSAVERSPGNYLIDYGRTRVGGLALSITGTAGQVLDIRYGSELDGKSVRFRARTGNTYQDIWTLKSGQQYLETWGMRVFRYVEISGAPRGLKAADFPATTLVYPFDGEAGVLTTSDNNLNAVWNFSKNTLEAVNGNLYVDTWERERGAYEADAYLQMRANAALMKDPTLGDYSFAYLFRDRTWPTEWPMYLILGMYESYLQTGDLAALSQNYALLKTKLPDRWFEESSGLIRKDTGSDGAFSCGDCDIVDWPADERDGYVFGPYNTVVNAIAYRSYADMGEIASALGHAADATAYAERATVLQTAINARMWDPAKGYYRDGLTADGRPINHFAIQASVFATAFGVADKARIVAVAQKIGERGMACSVFCAAFLIESLYLADDGTAAFGLLTGPGNRSWRGMLDQGAGSTMEAWNTQLKPNTSFSHPWGASPAYTVPEGVFGVRPTSPGYATFQIKPQTDKLTWAELVTPTVRGRVGVSFVTTTGSADVRVLVPPNSTASVLLPVAPNSTDTAHLDGQPVPSTLEGGYRTVADVGPGCHVLSISSLPVSGMRTGGRDVCAPDASPSSVAVVVSAPTVLSPAAMTVPVTVTASTPLPVGRDVAGTVRLFRDGELIGVGPVTAGGAARARLFRPLPVGSHPLVARYSGNAGVQAASSPVITPRVTFLDYPRGQFLEDIEWMSTSGITRGSANGTLFEPANSMTRRDLAAWLYRLENAGATAPPCTTAPAVDVPATVALCGEIAWMYRARLTTGYADGTFQRTTVVTRQQIAAFLFRSATGRTGGRCTGPAPFPDVPSTATFCEAIAWAAANGITTGYADGRFKPGAEADRQAVAAFLHRFADLD